MQIAVPRTIADGAATTHLGKHTFPIIEALVDDIVTVSDALLVETMKFFAERMKMIVEPTGCLGYAAARRMRAQLQGQRIGIVISGGNIDLERFCALVGG